MMQYRKNIMGRVQEVIDERAMLVSYARSHFPDCLNFIVAIMKQRCVGMGGHGLTELDEYSFLLRLVVHPKRLIGVGCIGYE